ncbi:MAG: hypothetical protein ACTSQJ_18045 [Promethearchaeota archaeon]
MENQEEYIIIGKRKNSRRFIFWFFFGIITFIAIYFPFFGGNLRFSVGSSLSAVFHILGKISFSIGSLMMIWGLFTLLCTRSIKSGIPLMVIGFLLCLFGSYLLDPSIIGFSTFGKEVPQGYH